MRACVHVHTCACKSQTTTLGVLLRNVLTGFLTNLELACQAGQNGLGTLRLCVASLLQCEMLRSTFKMYALGLKLRSSAWNDLPSSFCPSTPSFEIGSHSGALAGLDSWQSSCLSFLNPRMKARANSADPMHTHRHRPFETIFLISRNEATPPPATSASPCSQQPQCAALLALGIP